MKSACGILSFSVLIISVFADDKPLGNSSFSNVFTALFIQIVGLAYYLFVLIDNLEIIPCKLVVESNNTRDVSVIVSRK